MVPSELIRTAQPGGECTQTKRTINKITDSLKNTQTSYRRGEAVVVRDGDGGIEGLKVEHQNRCVCVKTTIRFQGERNGLGRPLMGPLRRTG